MSLVPSVSRKPVKPDSITCYTRFLQKMQPYLLISLEYSQMEKHVRTRPHDTYPPTARLINQGASIFVLRIICPSASWWGIMLCGLYPVGIRILLSYCGTCNNKTSPFSPFRFWRKNSGHGQSIRSIATTIRITGKNVQRNTR